VPVEEEVTVAEEPVGGGATAVLDTVKNLTYIDVRILERGGGGRGGGGGGPRLEQEMVQERARYCQDGTGECCTDGSACLAVRERTGEIAQLQARIECRDEVCRQFQAQLRELVQVLEQLQLRTCTAEGECMCTCEAGDDCLLLRDRIRDLDGLRDQSCELCTGNDCPCDVELLDALGAALVDLSQSLASPQPSFFMFLPTLMDSEQ
jgi:hypothetical protein